MTVVYADKVFGLNLCVNYLLLLSAARLRGMPLQRKRLGICAALGALYAVAVFLPGCAFLAGAPARLAAGLAMAWLGYRPLQQRWRLIGLFFLLCSMLAGVVLAVSIAVGQTHSMLGQLYFGQINWLQLLLITVGTELLLRLLFWGAGQRKGGELMQITVSIHGQERSLLALHDTGNTLRDPVNGQPVLVMESRIMEHCWEKKVADIMAKQTTPEETIAVLHRHGVGGGFTLLPYRSVGMSSGLLLAVRSDYIRVGRATYPRAWVALTPAPVSDNGVYRALWGGTKRGEEHAAISAETVQTDHRASQAG